MSTNYYTLDGVHVGNRWAAGMCCYDCGVKTYSLYAIGSEPAARRLIGWKCPRCGIEAHREAREDVNPALVELGFQRPDWEGLLRPTGIAGAFGWIWQIGESGLGATVEEIADELSRHEALKDEYGGRVPQAEFWAMFTRTVLVAENDREFR